MTISESATASLLRLLQLELAAVHQQFTHVLALRDWGHNKAADRIMAVDEVDFPNAMRILDYLVRKDVPIVLELNIIRPGSDLATVLRAERDIEAMLSSAIASVEYHDGEVEQLVKTAFAPRGNYRTWLNQQLSTFPEVDVQTADPFPQMGIVFSCLLRMIEQTMAHAFVHWHAGEADLADASWLASGSAMMQATDCVHAFAAAGAAPAPRSGPRVEVGCRSLECVDLDQRLAAECLRLTENASREEGSEMPGALCARITEFFTRVCEDFPKRGNWIDQRSRAFDSFETTLGKFVR